MKQGKVVLIGAGPGDPGLLTVKGRRILSIADTVIYDRLVGPGILSLIPPSAERIDVGKQSGNHPVPQRQINQILLDHALKGRLVVRLKGGDPFVFGRGGEELDLLEKNGIPFEIVPGITSAIAAPAYAGIPVTHREYASSLHIITAHGKNSGDFLDFSALAALPGTLVFLMGVSSLTTICRGLLQGGLKPQTPASVVEQGTSSMQRTIISTLEQLPEQARNAGICSPAVIVVGEVCGLAQRFHWADRRVLNGIRVLVTRPRNRSSRLTQMLMDLGAEVIEYPCIQTIERPLTPETREALSHISQYSWVVFTSAAGVSAFYHALMECGLDSRVLSSCRFAAIGPTTAQVLKEKGISADYIPSVYCCSALAEGLCASLSPDDHVLIPRASEGNHMLTDVMRQNHASYTELPLYDTELINNHTVSFDALCEKEPCYAIFTSASTVRGFAASHPHCSKLPIRAVCIGEQTALEARAAGLACYVAEEATLDSVVDCLCSIVSRDFLH